MLISYSEQHRGIHSRLFNSWGYTHLREREADNSYSIHLASSYGLLASAVFTRNFIWLGASAAASALKFSGSATLHATLPQSSTVASELEVFGTSAAMATGFICIILIMIFSKSIKTRAGRALIRVWVTLVHVCRDSMLNRSNLEAWLQESPHVTRAGELLNSRSQLYVRKSLKS
jgi:hypothetical protein